jgi:hypothetical protein
MEKHKSKYKKPENKKPTSRKDLKDYTLDDKDGTMNPHSTKEKQTKVPRKTDKPVIDDVENMVPKLTDKDRTYKKLEDANYDPKHAAKYFDDNQKTDTTEYFEKIKNIDRGVTTIELQEKLKRLTPENKERLIREYIRRKIVNMLSEQPEVDATEPAEDTAADAPLEPDTAQDQPTQPEDTEDPTDSTDTDLIITPEDRFVKYLKQQDTGIDKATAVITALSRSIKDADTDQKLSVYKMLQSYAIAARNAVGDIK